MANQRIIGLAILVVSFYFLAGGVFDMDWALRGLSGQTPAGFARNVIRIIYAILGSIMVLVGGFTLLSPT